MTTFSVPIIVEINGTIDVEASSQEEAIELAKEEYDRRYKANMKESFGSLACNVMDCPDVEVTFAAGDYPEEVFETDLDEDEDEDE